MGASVLSVFTLSLPTVMDSTAQANVSNTVDLPEPFSPTKKLTGVVNRISLRERTTGTVNGKSFPSLSNNGRKVRDWR
jgi:hypothetical protein